MTMLEEPITASLDTLVALDEAVPVAARVRLIRVRLNAQRLWRWQVWLVEALAALPDCEVAVSLAAGEPLPGPVRLLLRLERTIYRMRDVQAGELVEPAAVARFVAPDRPGPALTLDLAAPGGGARTNGAVLRPIYCGDADDLALIAALLSREEVRLGFDDRPLEHQPAVESPDVLTRALNTVFSALLRLCLQRVTRRVGIDREPRGRTLPALSRPTRLPIAAFMMRTVREKASWRLTELCRRAPRWRVGWRETDVAGSLGSTHRLPAAGYRVLPDDGRRYYADPFVLVAEGQRFLFVEEYPYATGRGLISAALLAPDGSIDTPRPVLETDGHLSYPFVVHHAGQVWMIPEACATGRVDLYRATRLPDRWELAATLLTGVTASDVTLTCRDGIWWMFAATQGWQASSRDALSLYSAPDLIGPWTPHPGNPVVLDQRSARPGGALFEAGGALWRPAQDATRGYGSALSLCRVDELTPESYAQSLATIIRPGPSWPGSGLHTLNFADGIEVVDGLVHSTAAHRPRG